MILLPPERVSFVVALEVDMRNVSTLHLLYIYPTISGIRALLPANIAAVGCSVKRCPSNTGWNVLYPEAVL